MSLISLNRIPKFLRESEYYRTLVEDNEDNLDEEVTVKYFVQSVEKSIQSFAAFELYLKLSDYWSTDEILFQPVKDFIRYHTVDVINGILREDLISSSAAAVESVKYALTLDINTEALYLIYILYDRYNFYFKGTNFSNRMLENKEILTYIFMKNYIRRTSEKNDILDYIIYIKRFKDIMEGPFTTKLSDSNYIGNKVYEIYSEVAVIPNQITLNLNALRMSDKYIIDVMRDLFLDKEYQPNMKIGNLTLFKLILLYSKQHLECLDNFNWYKQMMEIIFSQKVIPVNYYKYLITNENFDINKEINLKKLHWMERNNIMDSLNKDALLIAIILNFDNNLKNYLNINYNWNFIEEILLDEIDNINILNKETYLTILKYYVRKYSD